MAQLPHFSVQVTSAPSAEPISVATAKSWLRVSVTDDDTKIAGLISTARSLVESWTWRPCLYTTYQAVFDRFPLIPNSQYSPGNPNLLTPVLQNTWPLDPSGWALYCPRAPLVPGSVSIQYQQVTGASLVTLDPSQYQVDAISELPRISPVAGSYWPGVIYQANAVVLTFQAGYSGTTDANTVPYEMTTAIMMLVSQMYDNPSAIGEFTESGGKGAIAALLDSVKVRGIF